MFRRPRILHCGMQEALRRASFTAEVVQFRGQLDLCKGVARECKSSIPCLRERFATFSVIVLFRICLTPSAVVPRVTAAGYPCLRRSPLVASRGSGYPVGGTREGRVTEALTVGWRTSRHPPRIIGLPAHDHGLFVTSSDITGPCVRCPNSRKQPHLNHLMAAISESLVVSTESPLGLRAAR